jgi:hypothetical protein
MQMIYSKMFVFPVFVCTLGKCSRKYSTLCVWSNVKQTHPCQPPKPTRNPPLPPTLLPTTINKKNPPPTTKPTTTATHPATHRNPPHTHPATPPPPRNPPHTHTHPATPPPPPPPPETHPNQQKKPITNHHNPTKIHHKINKPHHRPPQINGEGDLRSPGHRGEPHRARETDRRRRRCFGEH